MGRILVLSSYTIYWACTCVVCMFVKVVQELLTLIRDSRIVCFDGLGTSNDHLACMDSYGRYLYCTTVPV